MSTFNTTDPAAVTAAAIALMEGMKGELNIAYATRYFCLAAFVIVLFDHISTFSAERSLIWPAVPSFTKYTFLINRYLVPVALLLSFLPLSGFLGLSFSDNACAGLLSALGTVAVCSLALGNGLVMMRVVSLWDHNKSVFRVMYAFYILTYGVTISTFLVALMKIAPGISWNPLLNMCTAKATSPWLIPSWGAGLIFELTVLAATTWNAFDRPRGSTESVTRALQKDGITFFLVMTVLRTVNVALVATQRPSLTLMGTFIVWSLVTVALNRSFLSLARTARDEAAREASERIDDDFEPGPSRTTSRAATGRASPFGFDRDTKGSLNWEAGAAIEVGRVEVQLTR